MCNRNKELFLNWVEQVEKLNLFVKYGSYEDDVFIDSGTMYLNDFDLPEYQPGHIIEMTTDYFLCSDDGFIERFYASDDYTDDFGQITIFRYRPEHYWFYTDLNHSDGIEFLGTLDDDSDEILLDDPQNFTDWANDRYPHSFSSAGEAYDSQYSQLFWECYTYNPMLSEEEAVEIMKQYINENSNEIPNA